jgi:hypothetical protein
MISINANSAGNPWSGSGEAEYHMEDFEVDTSYHVDVGGVSSYLQFRN